MTAIELKTSIVDDLSLMSEDMLRKMSNYGKRLLTRSRKQSKQLFAQPTKIEIDDDIRNLMGRFPLPENFDEKEFVKDMHLKDYLAL